MRMAMLPALFAAFGVVAAIAVAALWELDRERQARIAAELENAGIPTA